MNENKNTICQNCTYKGIYSLNAYIRKVNNNYLIFQSKVKIKSIRTKVSRRNLKMSKNE